MSYSPEEQIKFMAAIVSHAQGIDFPAVAREFGVVKVQSVTTRLDKILQKSGYRNARRPGSVTSARSASSSSAAVNTPPRARGLPRPNGGSANRVIPATHPTNANPGNPRMNTHANGSNPRKTGFAFHDLTADSEDGNSTVMPANMGSSQEEAIKLDSDDETPTAGPASKKRKRTALGTEPVIKSDDEMTEQGDIVIKSEYEDDEREDAIGENSQNVGSRRSLTNGRISRRRPTDGSLIGLRPSDQRFSSAMNSLVRAQQSHPFVEDGGSDASAGIRRDVV